ncbi:MAG: glycosyltransferase [Spirochaetales bacterium]|nr:glycosyltransferase [Spirochaetales bacterium]
MNQKKKTIINRKNLLVALFYMVTAAILFLAFFLTGKDENFVGPIWKILFIFLAPLILRLFVYIFLGPWYSVAMAIKDARLSRERKNYTPRVSLLLPAWNEEVGIIPTIQSALESDYRNLEIIVINDGSTDNTDSLVRQFIARNVKRIRESGKSIVYEYKTNGGKAKALNRGITLSSGDIIITIDADCILEPSAISNFVKRFRDPKVMCVAGNIMVGNTNTLLGIVQFFEYLFSFYLKKVDSLLNTIYIVGGAAAAYRRSVFEQFGYFSADTITEDIDLSIRIQDAGMKIEFAADAVVYTEGATDLGGLLKQRLRWKRGRIDTFWKYRYLFFSTKKRHNKLFTCVVLPFSVYSELELFLEVYIVGLFIMHLILSHNFSGFLIGLAILAFLFYLILSSPCNRKHFGPNVKYIFVGWMLFYIAIFVEYNALVKSIVGFMKKDEIRWQCWKRKGVFGE